MVDAAVKPYPLDISFGAGVTSSQQQLIQSAADRWRRAILSPVPGYCVNGLLIEGILVSVDAQPLASGIEGRSSSTCRPASLGLFPVTAQITFDRNRIAQQEATGHLHYVAGHELCHALGFGQQLWTWKGLVTGSTGNVVFNGSGAMAEFGRLTNRPPTPVPAEEQSPGSGLFHWRETIFGDELMSTYEPNRALSRVTLASLADLGYIMDLSLGDPYQLPRQPNFLARLLRFGRKQAKTSYEDRWQRSQPVILPELTPGS